MVTQMGFSDLLGNVDLRTNYSRLSSETKQKIENEVQRLVDEGRQTATKLLTEKRKELDLVAKALVEYEILNLDEMNKILRGEKLPKLSAAAPPSPPSALKRPDTPLATLLGTAGIMIPPPSEGEEKVAKKGGRSGGGGAGGKTV